MKKIIQLSEFDFNDVDETYLKYKDVTSVDSFSRTLHGLHDNLNDISTLMLVCGIEHIHNYDMIKLDIKVKNLKAGDQTCGILDWHYDWVKDYDHKNKHEKHLIYSNVFGTMFKVDGKEVQVDNNCIYEYGRELHRGVIVPEDCKRVLIRMSFVDKLR